MDLKSFVNKIKSDIDLFEKHYQEQHKQNPEQWPLDMQEFGDGLWWEMFVDFEREEVE